MLNVLYGLLIGGCFLKRKWLAKSERDKKITKGGTL